MADDTVRGPRSRRTVVVAVAAWLAVVVVASGLAWFAIGRAGSEVLDPAVQQVPTTTSSPASTGTPSTGATSVPPSTDPTTPPPTSPPPTTSASTAPPVDEVTTVAGGQAGFRCTGDALTLRFAQPATGWSVRQDSEDGRIRVEFESDAGKFRIEAACSGGEPSVTVESDDHDGGGDDD